MDAQVRESSLHALLLLAQGVQLHCLLLLATRADSESARKGRLLAKQFREPYLRWRRDKAFFHGRQVCGHTCGPAATTSVPRVTQR